MRLEAAVAAALVVIGYSTAASAGPVVDAATRAETLQAEGKVAEALAALAEAAEAICSASPLAFQDVAIVDSGDGKAPFAARTSTSFKPDEKLRVQFKPVCLKAGADGSVGFKADLAFENDTGQVLGESQNVFSLSQATSGAFSPVLSFGVPYLRPGEYKATFTVHDDNSDKSGSFDVPFTITLPSGG